MTRQLRHCLRPNRAALGMRWLVLVVILLGTIISSVGGTNSHGIAPIGAALHAAAMPSDASDVDAHEHAHEVGDRGLAMAGLGATADHPHHGSDHSHDKAHVLPVGWNSAAARISGWLGLERPWIAMVQASRLERPPMG